VRALGLVFLLVPSIALAEPRVCGPQNYDSETEPDFECPSPTELEMVPRLRPPPSVPVEVGDIVEAQWEGAVVHRDRLIQMGLTIRALRRLRWADRLRIHAEYEIRLTHQTEVCDARLEHAEERTEVYREALGVANERVSSAQAWYRSWWFGYLMGVLSAGALVALTAYALMAI
jgi:hypothetical protein